MSESVPYMTAEIGVLQSQQIEHVLLIYTDKKVLQIERGHLSITLKTLDVCGFSFKSIVPLGDSENLHLLISF